MIRWKSFFSMFGNEKFEDLLFLVCVLDQPRICEVEKVGTQTRFIKSQNFCVSWLVEICCLRFRVFLNFFVIIVNTNLFPNIFLFFKLFKNYSRDMTLHLHRTSNNFKKFVKNQKGEIIGTLVYQIFIILVPKFQQLIYSPNISPPI